MRGNPRKQQGAILVLSALLVVLLLGVAAFALDLGRLHVLKSEMQNAADTAARAGAMELDRRDGARNRAVAAITGLLSHQTRFARNPELLEQLGYTPGAPEESAIVFYSWIGSEHDPDVADPAAYCAEDLGGTWLPAEHKCMTTRDHDARYVEVKLYPDPADEDSYTVDLFFLPVLEVLVDDVARVATTRARAVAGRHFLVCNYPPVMICNPFEGEGKSFAQAVADGDLEPGISLALKYQRNQWGPGNFAFLTPRDADGNEQSGASALGDYLANPELQGCTPPVVRTQTGTIQSHPLWAWNTRFDTYRGGYNHNNSVPAPNVMEYPQDTGFQPLGEIDRFGDGNWARDEYWEAFHSYHEEYANSPERPPGFANMTRWELYNWELEAGFPACDPRGQDGVEGTNDDIDCLGTRPNDVTLPIDAARAEHNRDPWSTPQPDRSVAYVNPDPLQQDRERTKPVVEGLPAPNRVSVGESVAERRVLFTAVIDCEAQGVSGNTRAVASDFAKFFMLQTATTGAGGGGGTGDEPESADFVVEFMELAGEEDDEIRVEVQLYE